MEYLRSATSLRRSLSRANSSAPSPVAGAPVAASFGAVFGHLHDHSPRADRPIADHTLAASNYLLLLQANKKDLTNWIVIRAVEELIKVYAPANWAGSFVNELEQSKKHDAFSENNVGDTAQFLCTFANIWTRITGMRI